MQMQGKIVATCPSGDEISQFTTWRLEDGWGQRNFQSTSTPCFNHQHTRCGTLCDILGLQSLFASSSGLQQLELTSVRDRHYALESTSQHEDGSRAGANQGSRSYQVSCDRTFNHSHHRDVPDQEPEAAFNSGTITFKNIP